MGKTYAKDIAYKRSREYRYSNVESKRGLLYENTIGFLQIELSGGGNMVMRQTYRGVINGKFGVMGESVL